MLKALIVAALVGPFACTPAPVLPLPESSKTDVPLPTPIEVPSQIVPLPVPSAATVDGTSQSYITVDRAVLDVPRAGEQVVDVPYAPLQMPQGAVNEIAAAYNIPQPVIDVPGPVVQSKPVVYNVPQQVIQVPEPVIRTRPVIYRVPHVINLQRPVLNHQQIFYQVPRASFLPKSANHQAYVPGTPTFALTV